jgi:ERCC4-type nuclease
MFVARLLDGSGALLDERVLDMVVERKSLDDLQSCLINKSKQYPPLSFFEAQMFKLQQTPGLNKVFLMEGDEDRPGDISVAGNPGEWVMRRKRVKTMRNQIGGNEWSGVKLVCTTDMNHSVQYLVDKMADFMAEGFDSSRLNLYRTMQEYKQVINDRMKDNTFVEYLRLRKIKGTGDVKAMKVIRDPNGPWDKEFQSPACTAKDKGYKSTLDDRAVYYESNNVGEVSIILA